MLVQIGFAHNQILKGDESMKKLLFFAVILLGVSALAVAQDVPRAEVFGGYTYLRCDTDDADLACNQHGWNASAAFNGNKWLGAVADFSGHYGKIEDEDINLHSFLFGPKVTFRSEKVTPFLQALFGTSRIGAGDESDWEFAMTFGGGLDINVNEQIAVRPAQVEYFTTKMGSDFLDHFRYSAGIVFKIGKQ